MYTAEGDIDADYLLQNELDAEEYRQASEVLVRRTYRKIESWERAVRSERGVEDVDSIARDAARSAYVLDKIGSDFFSNYGGMSDIQLEVFNAGNRAWRTVNEAGKQLRYEGRDPEEIEEGSFVLINGENTQGPKSGSGGESYVENYTLPSDYMNEFSERLKVGSIHISPTVKSREGLPEDDFSDF